MEALTPDAIALALVWVAAFLFSATIHEAAHATAALWLGDRTAYEGGQVTLNPWPHIQRAPVGMVVVPLVSALIWKFAIGWASAPYDPYWAQRHPRRAALMALAGPVSNLLVAMVVGIVIKVGLVGGWLEIPPGFDYHLVVVAADPSLAAAGALLSVLFTLNILLFVFNLLPFPPLDGAAILPLVMPESWARAYQDFFHSQPMFSLLGLILAWRVLPHIFGPLLGTALFFLYL
ncbi:MAG: site-2 protease family protein [Acidobacteriota bacterium]